MSTYNGENYVGEQLDSILQQTFNSKEYTLDVFCRDDNSNDGTLILLEKYSQSFECVHILENSGISFGVRGSFYSLLASVDADFYFFCDQDDVWKDDKIKKFLEKFSQVNTDIPGGVYSDLMLVDAKNNSLHKTMSKIQKWPNNEDRSLALFLFQTRVTGAAFAVNRKARDKVVTIGSSRFKNVLMHDSILALIARSYNNLFYLSEPLVNYRQHGNNVLGAMPQRHTIFDIHFKVKHYRRLFNDLRLVWEVIGDDPIPIENRRLIEGALELSKTKNFGLRVKSILRNYKAVWSNYNVRHTLLLLFFFN